MKKLFVAMLAAVAALVSFGIETFEFINSDDGYSYIQINENLDSFSFSSDWHSLGNAGKVGYVIYTSDMSADERAAYIEANANNPQFGKKINNGIVDIGSLKAGDKVGFYETRPNGATYTHTTFKDWKNDLWLAFDKNSGHGKDEWMSISSITYSEKNPASPASPVSGAPLPGALATLLVGGIAAVSLKKKRQ